MGMGGSFEESGESVGSTVYMYKDDKWYNDLGALRKPFRHGFAIRNPSSGDMQFWVVRRLLSGTDDGEMVVFISKKGPTKSWLLVLEMMDGHHSPLKNRMEMISLKIYFWKRKTCAAKMKSTSKKC